MPDEGTPPAHLMAQHAWVKLQDYGQGPRDICRECGITRTPLTEGGACAGAHQRTGRVISEYDPFS